MISANQAALLVIDVQGKLAGLMHSQMYLRHVQGIIKAAQILNIPILLTEQAPDKIGGTVPEIRNLLADQAPLVKQTFSCCGEPAFMDAFTKLGRSQVIVTGIEAHVCVYQTVRDFLRSHHEVHLVTDAVSSRAGHNSAIGIKRSEDEGAVLTTTEMIITELIQSTSHPNFREIMALLKNSWSNGVER